MASRLTPLRHMRSEDHGSASASTRSEEEESCFDSHHPATASSPRTERRELPAQLLPAALTLLNGTLSPVSLVLPRSLGRTGPVVGAAMLSTLWGVSYLGGISLTLFFFMHTRTFDDAHLPRWD